MRNVHLTIQGLLLENRSQKARCSICYFPWNSFSLRGFCSTAVSLKPMKRQSGEETKPLPKNIFLFPATGEMQQSSIILPTFVKQSRFQTKV